MTPRLLVVVVVGLGGAMLPACDQHEPFCEGTTVMCVESCDTGAFLQCETCPEGTMPAESCAAVDAGR